MRPSLRPTKTTIAAAVALVTPVIVGFGLTAGASVGSDGNGFGLGFGSGDHTVDQFDLDGWSVEREQLDDDPITLVVTDPDGSIVDPADYDELPVEVGDLVGEVSDQNWTPEDDTDPFEVVDGVPCHHPVTTPDTGIIANDPTGTYAIEVLPNGEMANDPVYFGPEFDHDHEVIHQAMLDGTAFDLDGAEPLPACD